jgi:hypothetical protein
MTSIQRLVVLSLGLSVFSTLAIAQQTEPGNPPPATSQTTTTTTVQDTTTPAPMTKREMKAQIVFTGNVTGYYFKLFI